MGDKNNDGDISMEDIENDIMFADDPAVEMTLYTFDNVVRLIDATLKRISYHHANNT